VNGKPYSEGDFILDKQGKQLQLKIQKIEKGKVLFVYQGVEVNEYLRD
jgi:hypothetical protein